MMNKHNVGINFKEVCNYAISKLLTKTLLTFSDPDTSSTPHVTLGDPNTDLVRPRRPPRRLTRSRERSLDWTARSSTQSRRRSRGRSCRRRTPRTDTCRPRALARAPVTTQSTLVQYTQGSLLGHLSEIPGTFHDN